MAKSVSKLVGKALIKYTKSQIESSRRYHAQFAKKCPSCKGAGTKPGDLLERECKTCDGFGMVQR